MPTTVATQLSQRRAAWRAVYRAQRGERMAYTLVEVQPGRYVILGSDGAFCGFVPVLKGSPPAVEGADPSLGVFPLTEAVAHATRFLASEAEQTPTAS